MNYSVFSCDLICLSDLTKDLLTAFLAECGFESFMEEDNQFKAYIQTENLDKDALSETLESNEAIFGKIDFSISSIANADWNSTWESSFEFVEICDKILVKTPECKSSNTHQYEILIKPQLAFGSGTHETTSLILQELLQVDCNNKEIADCGCGTGILGIFASMRGAKSVFAFDYDDNCVTNTIANCQLNQISNLSVEQAQLDILQGKNFDIVLANINKNILIDNMQYLANSVRKNGIAILSGFYNEDVDDITKFAQLVGLEHKQSKSNNNWTIIIFTKK